MSGAWGHKAKGRHVDVLACSGRLTAGWRAADVRLWVGPTGGACPRPGAACLCGTTPGLLGGPWRKRPSDRQACCRWPTSPCQPFLTRCPRPASPPCCLPCPLPSAHPPPTTTPASPTASRPPAAHCQPPLLHAPLAHVERQPRPAATVVGERGHRARHPGAVRGGPPLQVIVEAVLPRLGEAHKGGCIDGAGRGAADDGHRVPADGGCRGGGKWEGGREGGREGPG